ncbi:MAG: sigma-70 family RNA polymerase sigma factor [Bacteroidetes bacterium]|nr:sigma-70 family RNA polymerase sigma factor [Bacteroidota bacterium]
MEVNPNLTPKAQRDIVLVQQAVRGERKAFAELLNNYRDSLYFLLLKLTNNPVDAEDLTIEAFGKAFRNLDQYSSEFAFSTWLFKIATNNCIDWLKRSRRITFARITDMDGNETDNYPPNLPSTLPGPDEKVIAKQKVMLMREVVEKLKPHYRLMIEMRYFEEYSYEEIAEKLDLPLGTVKAQLFRAREFLYNILKGAEERI